MRRRDFCRLAAVAALAAYPRGSKAAPRTLQVGLGNYPGMSPFFVALERGYFREAGIDAQPQMIVRASEIVALLAAGRLDAGISSIEPAIFNAVGKGAAVRIVLGREKVTLACGDSGALYARKPAFTRGTADLREWSGKKICAGQGAGLSEFLLDTMLLGAGVDPMQVLRPRLSTSQAVAALISGAIDGYLQGTNVPMDFGTAHQIVREEAGRKFVADIQISHLLFGVGLVKGEPAVGARFLAAYLRGVKDFEAGVTPKFLKDMVAEQGRSAGALGNCRHYNTAGGAIDLKTIRMARDWSVRRGYTPGEVSAESVVDGRFLELARGEMGGKG